VIARVFATKTSACPTDAYAFFDQPPLWLPDDVTEIHVSCTFSWARQRAEQLAHRWEATGLPVKVGGVAYGERGGDFVPGMYLRQGLVITSRGCNNRCWFCSVPKREGRLRELSVQDGWEILDDNLLRCSDTHINEVFAMLSRQPHRAEFTGGLEAARLKRWHVKELHRIKAAKLYFAYDTPDDREPLYSAGMLLKEAWAHPENRCYCYVLCGYKGDTLDKAERRMRECWEFGFTPFAMLYRGEDSKTDPAWRAFQRTFARPAAARSVLKGRTGVAL
jgi:hypothetical protein